MAYADRYTVGTVVQIHPSANTRLSGLYTSGGMFCTQCEAEGFRRITFAQDRPDVMSTFSVSLSFFRPPRDHFFGVVAVFCLRRIRSCSDFVLSRSAGVLRSFSNGKHVNDK